MSIPVEDGQNHLSSNPPQITATKDSNNAIEGRPRGSNVISVEGKVKYSSSPGLHIDTSVSDPVLCVSIDSRASNASSYQNNRPFYLNQYKVYSSDQMISQNSPVNSQMIDMTDELARKRLRRDLEDEEDKAKNRGNYRCSKCMQPKKGHICTYQPKVKSKAVAFQNGFPSQYIDTGIQCEIDPSMTVRLLDLLAQGNTESYFGLIMRKESGDSKSNSSGDLGNNNGSNSLNSRASSNSTAKLKDSPVKSSSTSGSMLNDIQSTVPREDGSKNHA